MKINFNIITFTLFFLFLSNSHAEVIYTATNPGNGHLYYLLDTKDWTDSQSEAVSLGGNLVTINDQAEQDWVYQTFSSIGGINRNLWIGYYETTPGTNNYAWISGEESSYSKWWGQNPDNYLNVEDYVHIMNPDFSSAGYWNDAPNHSAHAGLPVSYGVVEVSANIPNPSILGLLMIGIISLGLVKSKKSRE